MGFFRGPLGKRFADLSAGQRATVVRTVSRQDVLLYMGVSGDLNPLYADSAYAGRTRYQRPVVPAQVVAWFACGAIAAELPGRGTVTLAHQFRASGHAALDERITIDLEVAELQPADQRAVMRYRVTGEAGQELLTGEAVVEPPQLLKPVIQHSYEQF